MLSDFMIDAANSRVANPKVIKTSIDTLKTARPAAFLGIDPLYAGHASLPRLKEVGRACMKPTAGGGSTMIDAVSARRKTAACISSAKATVSRNSPPITCAAVQPVAHRQATCLVGLPVPLADVALLDDNDEQVGMGESGEIFVPEASQAAFTAGGYSHAGGIDIFGDLATGALRLCAGLP